MQRIYTPLLLITFAIQFASAQITGDTSVCAGYYYTYSVNITGAASYQWTVPIGWFNMQGQGTAQITALCNLNDSNVCVTGFDSLGISLGTYCLTTHFVGGGMGGSKAILAPTTACYTGNPPILTPPTVSVTIVPDTSGGWGSGGGCGGGCGGGISDTNIMVGVYYGSTFMGLPNGLPFQVNLPPGTYTFSVYAVDTLNGKNLPQAIIIGGGGCGSSSGNSSLTFTIPNFLVIPVFISPDICIGTEGVIDWGPWQNFYNVNITSINGCFLSGGSANMWYVTPTTTSWNLSFTCTLASGCIGYGSAMGWAMNCYITGDTVVCPGKTYIYHATFPPGNAYFNWTVPVGWYGLTGQGTSAITVTANSNAGNVCCTYGVPQNFCLTTHFGDGASEGWNIHPDTIQDCSGATITSPAYIENNSTGGGGSCPAGCGNGVQHPNIIYAVYDSIWPYGNFAGVADSISQITFPGYATQYYVYKVDTTLGVNPPLAILISGGCNVGTINNVITIDTVTAPVTIFSSLPSVCIDSIITISTPNALLNPQWNIAGGIIVTNNISSIDIQPTSLNCVVTLSGIDSLSGCSTSGNYTVNVNPCNSIFVAGDSTVCAGYTYTYNAIMPHATNYAWILPSGWYDISGQGSSQIMATANSNAGAISVSGFDSTGYFIASATFIVDFKICSNKSVAPSTIKTCKTDSVIADVVTGSLGTGVCLLSCGNGIKHANIDYAAYDNFWPTGNFKGFVNGSSNISPLTSTGNLFVYQIDFTNGTNTNDAVLITGECGTCSFNNIIQIDTLPVTAFISSIPSIGCVGDTIMLNCSNNFFNPVWASVVSLNFIDSVSNPAIAIVSGVNPSVGFVATDSASGCNMIGNYSMNNETCFYPVASFNSNKTSFCEKQYVDFYDMTSNNPTSWQWTFNGGVPSTSTLQNPDSIYYATTGMYDVQLIASNTYNSDTLLMLNYIIEYSSPPTPVITSNGGVLYCTSAITYAWYSTSNPTLILSTDSFYIPIQAGDYFVIITDSNGCNAVSQVVSYTGLQQFSLDNYFKILEITQNVFEISSTNKNIDVTVDVKDVNGKTIMSKKTKSTIQLNLENFAKGIYLLNISTRYESYTKKIVLY